MKVAFIRFQGELLAVFPDQTWNLAGDLTCYAHVGQHGACYPTILNDHVPLTLEDPDVADLYNELTQIGYKKLTLVRKLEEIENE